MMYGMNTNFLLAKYKNEQKSKITAGMVVGNNCECSHDSYVMRRTGAVGKQEEQGPFKEFNTGYEGMRMNIRTEEKDLEIHQLLDVPIPVTTRGTMDCKHSSFTKIDGEEDMFALMNEDIKDDMEIAIETMASRLPVLVQQNQSDILLRGVQQPSQNKHITPPTSTQIRGGEWTKEEHELFLYGFHQFGSSWTKVAKVVQTRTNKQIRSHAQNYFKKCNAKDSA